VTVTKFLITPAKTLLKLYRIFLNYQTVTNNTNSFTY